MDTASLQTKVHASRLLTEEERTYWLSNLSRMTPQQCGKLDTILTEAQTLPWQQEMTSYMTLIECANTFCKSKTS